MYLFKYIMELIYPISDIDVFRPNYSIPYYNTAYSLRPAIIVIEIVYFVDNIRLYRVYHKSDPFTHAPTD